MLYLTTTHMFSWGWGFDDSLKNPHKSFKIESLISFFFYTGAVDVILM